MKGTAEMTNRVSIKPMPLNLRAIPREWWPGHPPIFPNGEPTHAEIELAIALFEKLDETSKDWYGRDLPARLRGADDE